MLGDVGGFDGRRCGLQRSLSPVCTRRRTARRRTKKDASASATPVYRPGYSAGPSSSRRAYAARGQDDVDRGKSGVRLVVVMALGHQSFGEGLDLMVHSMLALRVACGGTQPGCFQPRLATASVTWLA